MPVVVLQEAFQRTKRLAQELEAKYKFLRISAEECNLRHERATLEAQCETSAAAQATIAPGDSCVISVSHPVDELIAVRTSSLRRGWDSSY